MVRWTEGIVHRRIGEPSFFGGFTIAKLTPRIGAPVVFRHH